jgi:hypothetical protein
MNRKIIIKTVMKKSFLNTIYQGQSGDPFIHPCEQRRE